MRLLAVLAVLLVAPASAPQLTQVGVVAFMDPGFSPLYPVLWL